MLSRRPAEPACRSGGEISASTVRPTWAVSYAACSSERLFCHAHGRSKPVGQITPGWPHSFFAVLTPGPHLVDRGPGARSASGPPTLWRPSPPASSRLLVDRLIAAGQWRPGDRGMLIVRDASCDVMRLARLLRDLPIELVGRLYSDCSLRLPAPLASTSPRAAGRLERKGAHTRPQTWSEPAMVPVNDLRDPE
ncbi:transposase [Streptomyces sp. NPDC001675]